MRFQIQTFTIIAGFIGILIVSACKSSQNTPVNKEPVSKVSIVTGNTAFATDVLKSILNKDENCVFSPYSISSAMALAFAGAANETEEEFIKVLHFPENTLIFHEEFGKLNRNLQNNEEMNIVLNLANNTWIHKGFDIQNEYKEILYNAYDIKIEEVDFSTFETRKIAEELINQWTAQQTNNLIREIIGPGMFNENTRMVLTNAIYFKGEWLESFKKHFTKSGYFYLSTGKKVTVPFMNGDIIAGYQEENEMQVLSLKYKGERFRMQFVLPRKDVGLEVFTEKLNTEELKTILADSEPLRVSVSIPKFRIESEIDAGALLKDAGMKKSFDERADFSRISGDRSLKIDKVVHKAIIDVNEAGTEAAAATAVSIGIKSALVQPSIKFLADRPFLFFLTDSKTGSILFSGIVWDPSE